MKSRVSICVPTYNGAAYLQQCLESALAQTFGDFELLVVDDGSNDDTMAIANDYARADRRVRLHQNRQNLGLVGNWNRCLELANGEWIKFLFQDDFLDPTCLERMIDAAVSDTGLIVCGKDLLFDPGVPANLVIGYQTMHKQSLSELFPNQTLIRAEAFADHMVKNPNANCIGEPSTVLIRRAVLDTVGFFNTNMIMLCDWELAARIAINTGIRFVNEPLVTFRVHMGSASAENRASRHFRMDKIDSLIILHEMALSQAYEPARQAARRCRPAINLSHHLIVAARTTKWLARQAAIHPSHPDPVPLEDWQRVISVYPRLCSLTPGYVIYSVFQQLKSRIQGCRTSTSTR